MKIASRFIARLLLTGMALLLVASCAGVAVKGYEGSDLPPSQTATIISGPYTSIRTYDGVKLGRSALNVTVLPGKHTIEARFDGLEARNATYNSDATGSVTFIAEGGHRYMVYAYLLLSEDGWMLYAADKESSSIVARSEKLPLNVYPILRDFAYP